MVSTRSISALKKAIKRLDLPYSAEEVDEILSEYEKKLDELNKRELASDWLVVYMDAKHLEVRDENGRVRKGVIYTVCGVNMEGRKEIILCRFSYGSESAKGWKEVLNDMRNRGMARVLIFVTDDFQGLKKLIQAFFPHSDHQLCLVHLLRNAKRMLAPEDYSMLKETFQKIMCCKSFDEAYSLLLEACEKLKANYGYFAKALKKKAENYVAFTKYPRKIWRSIKSTNPVEALHLHIEKLCKDSGGYFQSERILKIKCALFIENLQEKWQRKNPYLISALPELIKIFEERYGDL